MKTTKIFTDEKMLGIRLEEIESVAKAMEFKANNIKAKADPELFMAARDYLLQYAELMKNKTGDIVCHCNRKENAELIAKILDEDYYFNIYMS